MRVQAAAVAARVSEDNIGGEASDTTGPPPHQPAPADLLAEALQLLQLLLHQLTAMSHSPQKAGSGAVVITAAAAAATPSQNDAQMLAADIVPKVSLGMRDWGLQGPGPVVPLSVLFCSVLQ